MSKKFLSPIKLAQGASNPLVGSAGELFFNTTDVKVYAHNGTSWVPSGGGVTVSATAPSTPIAGDAWYDTVDGTLYVYYNDGDSSQWVEVAANSGISVALEGRVGVLETYVTTLQSEMDTAQADIDALEALFPVSIAHGGTGATTVTGAQNSLGVGLVPVLPTSVSKAGGSSTVTVDANGFVTYSQCTSISINGVFTSAFRNYRMVLTSQVSTSAVVCTMRMRAGGTDNTGLYVWGGTVSRLGGTAVQLYQSSSSNFFPPIICNAVFSSPFSTSMDIINPSRPAPTTVNLGGYWGDSSNAFGIALAGLHAVSTAYDGFSIATGVGTISGTLQVFGYNNEGE